MRRKSRPSVYERLKTKKRTKTVKCRICGVRFKYITGLHLRKHDMTSAEYDRQFGQDSRVSEETRFRWAKERVGCTSDVLLSKIRDLTKGGRRLNASQVRISDRKLYFQAKQRFGSWAEALMAAGLDLLEHAKDVPPYYWSAKKVIAAIKTRAHAGCPMFAHAITRDIRSLHTAAVRHFKSWVGALRAAGLNPEDYINGRVWTREKIIVAVGERRAEGKALNASAVDEDDGSLYSAAVKRFGSWDDALLATGLDPNQIRKRVSRWTRKRVVREILRLEARGRPIFYSAANKIGGLAQAGCRHFGSWDEALRAAGLSPSVIKKYRPWTEERLLSWVRKRALEGKPLNIGAISPSSIVKAGKKKFGSWEGTLEAAGIDPELGRIVDTREPRRVLRKIREYHGAGKDMAYTAMREFDSALVYSGQKLFGTWARALKRAGLSAERFIRKPKWTHETVIRAIRAEHAAGRPLNADSMKGRISRMAAVRIFGCWDNALLAAGYDPMTERKKGWCWTAEAIIKGIHDRLSQGLPMNPSAVERDDSKLAGAGTRRFGNWSKALTAAGLDPAEHRLQAAPWTREGIIELIRDRKKRGHGASRNRAMPSSAYGGAQRLFGSWQLAVKAALGKEGRRAE